jgi:hypothetical protein
MGEKISKTTHVWHRLPGQLGPLPLAGWVQEAVDRAPLTDEARAYIGDMSETPPDKASAEAAARRDAEAEARRDADAEAEARRDAEAEAAATLDPEAEGEE